MYGLPPFLRSFVSSLSTSQSMPVAAIICPPRRVHRPGMPPMTNLYLAFRLLSRLHPSSGRSLKCHAVVHSVIAGRQRQFRKRPPSYRWLLGQFL